MTNEWIEIENESKRVMYFKSNPNAPLHLTNVTHYKKRSHGSMLKCDQGIVYFEADDVSRIISQCADWVV